MKKIVLLMLVMMLSVSAMAQFTLTPAGLVNTDNVEQNFITMDFPGKTQAQLYSSALMYLNSIYVSPKEVLSVVDNNSITVNGVSESAIYRKKSMTSTVSSFDINYTITILFKDGKIRINNPSINRMNIAGNYDSQFFVVGFSGIGVFNQKDKLLAEETKTSIEKFFNTYVNDLKLGIEKSEAADW